MVDPITVSVLTHRFEAIVQEMGEAMLRTAYSQILNSSRDFSTAIADRESRLVAQAEHVPIHVGSMPWAVQVDRRVLRGTRPARRRLPAQRPVSRRQPPARSDRVRARLRGRRAAVLVDQPVAPERHRWLDARRLQPGGDGDLAGGHPHHAAQALRRRRDARRRDEDDRDQRAPRGRLPRRPARDDRLRAGRASAACSSSSTSTAPKTVKAAVDEILDSAERETRACISHVEGRRVPRRVRPRRRRARHRRTSTSAPRVTVQGDSLHDRPHRLASPRCTGFINSSFPNMMSAVYMAFTFLIDPRTPKNSGTFRPIEVIAKQGTDRLAVAARAGHARRRTTAPRRSPSRSSRRSRSRARSASSRGGGAASASRSRASIRAPSASSSGTSSTPVPAAAPRRPATAGRRPARGRRRAASSSARSRSPRRGSRCSSSTTSSGRTPSATASFAAAPARCSGCAWRRGAGGREHRGRRHAAPVVRDPRRSGRRPHRYRLCRGGKRARCSRRRRSTCRSCPATCSSSSRPAVAGTARPAKRIGGRAREPTSRTAS